MAVVPFSDINGRVEIIALTTVVGTLYEEIATRTILVIALNNDLGTRLRLFVLTLKVKIAFLFLAVMLLVEMR